MELTQVRYFLALCRTRNFTRAAEACNVTQPAFSRAIQRLEEELAGALIFRERSTTTLTELGREMLPHLTAMVEAADAAQACAKARRLPQAGNLRIGLAPGITAAPIAAAIAEVLRVFPGAELHFSESSAPALAESMLADALDCALVPEDSVLPERLNRWPLYTESAVLVCPASHRLAGKNACAASDLVSETLLVGDACGGFAQMLAAPPRLQHCRGSAAQICELVAAGLGLALLSNRISAPPPLTTRPFNEPELTRTIELTTLAGRPLAAAAASFIKLCRAQAFT
ncbi:LysR family transcriptional regulator [Acidocella sp.]|uniref:LysR family transcriptional regulator n=1 Tax=Acidocella sp. TaxID=50710 RepID=UPI00262B8AD3|nr:LysR family transcriptional regulator [Acidocella sp.]